MSRRRPRDVRPGAVDGLNVDDPGLRLVADALQGVEPARVISVCSGDVPGWAGKTPRVVLDAREASGPLAIAITDDAAAAERPGTSHAVVWPRAHLGKDFAQQMLARAGLLVPPQGQVLCAVRKQKGADTLADFMGQLYSDVRIAARDRGYRLLTSPRTDAFDSVRARELVALRYRYDDARLGDLHIETAPGVFARKALDEGTACIMDHAQGRSLNPTRVLDLCAGVGPLLNWALRRWPQAQGLAVESNFVAAELLGHNLRANGLDSRATALARDGLPLPQAYPDFAGHIDLALINPPTHADVEALTDLLSPLRTWMRPGAPAVLVASRPDAVAGVLKSAGALVSAHPYEKFTVLRAAW